MKKLFSVLLENGIIISMALGISYLLSYYYQKGKLDYYGVPLIYADFSLPNIVEIFAVILTVVYIAVLFVNPVVQLAIGTRDYRMYKIWGLLIGLAIIFGVEIVLIDNFPIISLTIAATLVVYVIIQIVLSLACAKTKGSFAEKWKAYSKIQLKKDEKEQNENSSGNFSTMSKNINSILPFVSILFLLCSMFQLSGENYARNRAEYYIADDYESKVVVHATQEYYVLMERDREQLLKNYEIVPAEEIGALSFEKTGSLNPPKTNGESK